MQISRHQPNVASPRPLPTASKAADPARPSAAGATAASERTAAPAPTQSTQAAQTPRERLGNLIEAYGARIDNLAAQEGLSTEQVGALKDAHSAFLQQLRDLAAEHLSGGEASSSLGKGLSAIKDTLRTSVQDALRPAAADTKEAATASATPAERLAAVQASVAQRLQSVLGNQDLAPREAAAFQGLASSFDALFERLGLALENGGLKGPGMAGQAFADLMNNLRQGVHELLGNNEPASALYTPTGPLADDRASSTQLEQLA